MKAAMAVLALASILWFSTGVWADGTHQPPTAAELKGDSEELQHSENHTDSNKPHADEGHNTHTGYSDIENPSSDGHGTGNSDEGHHGPVVETPPNYKVLGTFGAINLVFILIGIWNKLLKRKGNTSWQS
ncbi:hypothetical protein [Ammoniphilus sp. 3BR4]|uniref:hypothetical protein n=1 Tax=Ammoniphilus sp. 3BR4 TaxID=3158265 RepID=UPI0034676517